MRWRVQSLLTLVVTNSVWYGCCFSSYSESRARYNLMEPIPLQVEHAAIEFIVEPFHPSGPCLCTMKISTQCCRVNTSYFVRNWETHGGRECLISSRTGPKDPPTAHWLLTVIVLNIVRQCSESCLLQCGDNFSSVHMNYWLLAIWGIYFYFYEAALNFKKNSVYLECCCFLCFQWY